MQALSIRPNKTNKSAAGGHQNIACCQPKKQKGLTSEECREVDLFHYILEIKLGEGGIRRECSLGGPYGPISHIMGAKIFISENFSSLPKRGV